MDTIINRRSALVALAGAGALAAVSAVAGTLTVDPVFAAIEAHRTTWAKVVAANGAGDFALGKKLYPAAARALAALMETAPTTMAGVRASIAYFIEWDEGCMPEDSGTYLRTLLRSPIFVNA